MKSEIKEAIEKVLELAEEQLNIITFEVNEPVQGTMYNDDDIADADEAIKLVKGFLNDT